MSCACGDSAHHIHQYYSIVEAWRNDDGAPDQVTRAVRKDESEALEAFRDLPIRVEANVRARVVSLTLYLVSRDTRLGTTRVPIGMRNEVDLMLPLPRKRR